VLFAELDGRLALTTDAAVLLVPVGPAVAEVLTAIEGTLALIEGVIVLGSTGSLDCVKIVVVEASELDEFTDDAEVVMLDGAVPLEEYDVLLDAADASPAISGAPPAQ